MQDNGRALHPAPRNGGKEPIILDEADILTDDELSSGSFPPLGLSPAKNIRAKLCRNNLYRHAFSNAISGASGQARREASKGLNQPDRALGDASVLLVGMMPSMSFVHPTFGIRPTFYMLLVAPIRGPEDMLSLPLRQHILEYEPPLGFTIPTFAMFDGFSNPYNHMLHYNQTMILNSSNDHLLWKVFLTSLRGPTLAWFHKLLLNLINSFNDLWVTFMS